MWPQWKFKVKKTILEVPMMWCFIDLAFQKLDGNFFMDRSSHRRCSVKKDVLRNFKNFTGKHLCWSLSLIKLHVCNHLFWGTSVKTVSKWFTLVDILHEFEECSRDAGTRRIKGTVMQIWKSPYMFVFI